MAPEPALAPRATIQATIHATCVRIGDAGVLIRGASGAGKSSLALRLLLDAPRALPPAALVADDRVALAVEHGALVARPAPALAGLIEVRGLGIRRMPYIAAVALTLVMDLAAGDATRLPSHEARRTILNGVELPRIAIPTGADAALMLAAWLTTGAEPD